MRARVSQNQHIEAMKIYFLYVTLGGGPLGAISAASSPGLGNIFRATSTRAQKRVAAKYDYIISVNAYALYGFH